MLFRFLSTPSSYSPDDAIIWCLTVGSHCDCRYRRRLESEDAVTASAGEHYCSTLTLRRPPHIDEVAALLCSDEVGQLLPQSIWDGCD